MENVNMNLDQLLQLVGIKTAQLHAANLELVAVRAAMENLKAANAGMGEHLSQYELAERAAVETLARVDAEIAATKETPATMEV